MPLTADNLTKAYGGKLVLNRLSHTFPAVGTVALMGPSGCGKTTLLRLIAGLERCDSGEVRHSAHTRLSMVFQEDRLLPTLTVLDNLVEVLGDRTPEKRQWAEYCLERCGLGGEGQRYPAQLSGGMKRRVAIARAMAYGGNLLLLDEPFKGLDDAAKEKVMVFVLGGEESQERLTLLVTHDREEAAAADGILRLDGPPLSVADAGCTGKNN